MLGPFSIFHSPFDKLPHQQRLPHFDFIIIVVDSQMTIEMAALTLTILKNTTQIPLGFSYLENLMEIY